MELLSTEELKKKTPTIPKIVFHKTRVELNHKNVFGGEKFCSEIKNEIISFVCLRLSCLFALRKRRLGVSVEHHHDELISDVRLVALNLHNKFHEF